MHLEVTESLDSSILRLLEELEALSDYPIKDHTVYQSIQRAFYPEGFGSSFIGITKDKLDEIDPAKEFLLRKKLDEIEGSPAYRLLSEIIHVRLKVPHQRKHRSSLYVILTQCMRKKVYSKHSPNSFPLPHYKETVDLNDLIHSKGKPSYR
ncbi:hypothetical protein DDZ13_08035 [Coraliomargarita sinensis]|uniref:Uncharacterized protein n=2 Tax=Coraliomargarita sinensis TaxID=2174842 RepID=A0A317ZEZ9_9BACT|nr:hypothetical protein DDZ13_08035 [Coraliomargarita sinensis]